MYFRRLALAMAVAAATLPAAALAQDAKPTKLTTDFGYVQTSGNTDVTTFTGADKLEHRMSTWLLTQEANAVWGETDGVESAGRYGASLRADRELGSHWSAYGLASWRRNVFSGISRQFDEGIGLAWHAVAQKPHTLDLELGAGLSQRLTTLEQQDDFGTARLGSKYTYEFSEKSKFEAGGAYVFNLNDSEDGDANARVSLTAPVAGKLALKAGYDFLYRNKPLPGLEKLDTTFGVGVQASF